MALDQYLNISIHALLAESDYQQAAFFRGTKYFYPRSPCGERRQTGSAGCLRSSISIHALLAESDSRSGLCGKELQRFLSTLSLRRATSGALFFAYGQPYFYPRSPCGERRSAVRARAAALAISIHALLAESDRRPHKSIINSIIFLSTLSLRRATVTARSVFEYDKNFYPRSPCGERPCVGISGAFQSFYFYPRSPCGERPCRQILVTLRYSISIHALLAESDTLIWDVIAEITISIHALLAESDARRASRQQPAGISIHALLAESDVKIPANTMSHFDFYPRSPCGERPIYPSSTPPKKYFYPRSPCGERQRSILT